MYDMSKLKVRYFSMKLKNGKILDIEPPKMKMLKKMSTLTNIETDRDFSENDITNLAEGVSIALSKNKQGYKVNAEKVCEDYDILEIMDFLTNYFEWVNSIQNQKN